MKYWVHLDSDVYISEVAELNVGDEDLGVKPLSKTFLTIKEAEAYADRLALAFAKGEKIGKTNFGAIREQLFEKNEESGSEAVTIEIGHIYNNGEWKKNDLHSIVVGNY